MAASHAGRGTLLALAATLVFVGAAQAHADLVGSEPAADAVLLTPPDRVQLLFSEPPEPRFVALRVYDANRARVDRGSARVSRTDARVVEVDLRDLAAGTYTVVWRAFSTDGHVARGVFSFGVGAGASPRLSAAFAAAEGGVPAAADVAVRWALYLALVAVVGRFPFQLLAGAATSSPHPLIVRTGGPDAPVSALHPVPDAGRREPALPGAGLVVASGGLVVALVVHALAFGIQAANLAEIPLTAVPGSPALPDLLSTRPGALWIVRSLLLLGLGAWMLVAWRRAVAPAVYASVGCGLGSSILLTLSAGGHASTVAEGAGVAVALDWLHLQAVSVWVGGLLQLLLTPRGRWPTVFPRFSRLAAISAGLTILTGLYGALVHVPTREALLDTAYGAALAGKLVLVGPVLTLGAVLALGRVWLGGEVRQGDAARAVGSRAGVALLAAEVVLAGAVVGLTSVLVTLPPATALLVAQPFRALETAGGLDLELRVTPNQAGDNRLDVVVRAPPAERRAIERVDIGLAMVDMDMGRRELVAEPAGPTSYVVEGAWLSMAGRWSAHVRVRGAGGLDATATYQFTVGQPPGANPPAISPARILLLAVVVTAPDGAARPNGPAVSAVLALVLGIALLGYRAAPTAGRPGAWSIRSLSLLLTGSSLLVVGLLLGALVLLDAYQRSQ